MDFNRIDLAGVKPGWGSIYQGGSADDAVRSLPGPLLVVVMDRGEMNEQFIDHGKSVEAVLAVWIDDSPTACLSDQALLALTHTVCGWLSSGGNVYDHCAAGISRSGYLDCAVHMAALGFDYESSLAYIRKERPQTSPNAGFAGQLKALEPRLQRLLA